MIFKMFRTRFQFLIFFAIVFSALMVIGIFSSFTSIIKYPISATFVNGTNDTVKLSTCVNASVNIQTRSKFVQTMEQFPWQSLIESFREKQKNLSGFKQFGAQFFEELLPFLVLPPVIPVNSSCKPPPLKFPVGVPPCRKLQKPKKLAVLFTHGFDADTLEILLHEISTLTDYFFILEATKTYYLAVQKPLLWEHLKTQQRFEQFASKVIHFTMDDSDVNYNREGESRFNPYQLQKYQEYLLFLKFLNWNAQNGYLFGDEDLVSFSDLDEVPSRDVVYYLKHCEIAAKSVDVGIWFPVGNLQTIFRTDYPVTGNRISDTGLQYTFAAPTFWNMKAIRAKFDQKMSLGDVNIGFRLRGQAEQYILGGMHMTDYNYIPYKLAKMMSKIEAVSGDCFEETLETLISISAIFKGENRDSDYMIVQELASILEPRSKFWSQRSITLTKFQEKYTAVFERVMKLPWFYLCNQDRYPNWNGNFDFRLL